MKILRWFFTRKRRFFDDSSLENEDSSIAKWWFPQAAGEVAFGGGWVWGCRWQGLGVAVYWPGSSGQVSHEIKSSSFDIQNSSSCIQKCTRGGCLLTRWLGEVRTDWTHLHRKGCDFQLILSILSQHFLIFLLIFLLMSVESCRRQDLQRMIWTNCPWQIRSISWRRRAGMIYCHMQHQIVSSPRNSAPQFLLKMRTESAQFQFSALSVLKVAFSIGIQGIVHFAPDKWWPSPCR